MQKNVGREIRHRTRDSGEAVRHLRRGRQKPGQSAGSGEGDKLAARVAGKKRWGMKMVGMINGKNNETSIC